MWSWAGSRVTGVADSLSRPLGVVGTRDLGAARQPQELGQRVALRGKSDLKSRNERPVSLADVTVGGAILVRIFSDLANLLHRNRFSISANLSIRSLLPVNYRSILRCLVDRSAGVSVVGRRDPDVVSRDFSERLVCALPWRRTPAGLRVSCAQAGISAESWRLLVGMRPVSYTQFLPTPARYDSLSRRRAKKG
jgi:hypothetical protein